MSTPTPKSRSIPHQQPSIDPLPWNQPPSIESQALASIQRIDRYQAAPIEVHQSGGTGPIGIGLGVGCGVFLGFVVLPLALVLLCCLGPTLWG